MPGNQTGVPMTYMYQNRQFILMAVGGQPAGQLVAFALPVPGGAGGRGGGAAVRRLQRPAQRQARPRDSTGLYTKCCFSSAHESFLKNSHEGTEARRAQEQGFPSCLRVFVADLDSTNEQDRPLVDVTPARRAPAARL